MEQGKVSVIIPTYNLAYILTTRAIPSILGQTYANLECIVVDDGSTDDTEQRVTEVARADARVRYFKIKNQGQSGAKNFGVQQARGEFIAFNDHDDEFLPTYLAVAVRAFEKHPTVAYLSCGAINRDEDGRESYYLPDLEPFWKLSIGNGWVFRAQAFHEGNIHSDPNISGLEDLDLHIQFHARYRGLVVDQPLRIYYLRNRPSSSALGQREYHRRFTRSFQSFFSKYRNPYLSYGSDAFAWLCFFGGLAHMRAGETQKGKNFFYQSWQARKSFIACVYLVASLFGYHAFLLFDGVKNRVMRTMRIRLLNRTPRYHPHG